ncbi:lysophospholipase [Amylibacter ulvae]|uniref:Lysophospholipase n=1 Tax=Paramylibacter ulvae TaxID=1651968 RepID=A0ABQ3CVU4_9RHOB|nr:alpha/beta fold hydrolase [Amylibacter ulvae]GHA46267.1 lysophospholipase [Amylibacter ulvae]
MYRFIMRTFGVVLLLVLALAAILVFGPRDNVDLAQIVNPAGGVTASDADAYLAAQESAFSDIKPNQQKQIIWAGAASVKTETAIVYLHGFSASATEIRPVPDMVAKELGANLYFARLPGHGRTGAAMGDVVVQDWINELAEAMSIARAIGERVVIMSTSTGGTLAAAALSDAQFQDQLAGIIFVSPNFAVHSAAAGLANLPFFRQWGPIVAGETRSFEARKPGQAENWTTSYPLKSVVPMMRLIDFVGDQDYAKTTIPALFYFSDDDAVVNAAVARKLSEKWGGAVQVINPTLNADDDEYNHVIAGDILSPSQNEPATAAMVKWISGLK